MEIARQFRLEKIDGTCVRLEPLLPGRQPSGEGLRSLVIETVESTPSTYFWGTATTCHRFDVIVRRVG